MKPCRRDREKRRTNANSPLARKNFRGTASGSRSTRVIVARSAMLTRPVGPAGKSGGPNSRFITVNSTEVEITND